MTEHNQLPSVNGLKQEVPEPAPRGGQRETHEWRILHKELVADLFAFIEESSNPAVAAEAIARWLEDKKSAASLGRAEEPKGAQANEIERLVGSVAKAAIQLAVMRWGLCSGEGVDPEEATPEQISDDAWNACIGIDTCDEEPIGEILELRAALQASIAPSAEQAHPANASGVQMVRKLYEHFQGPHACGDFTCCCGNCGLCEFRTEVEKWLAVAEAAPAVAPQQEGRVHPNRKTHCEKAKRAIRALITPEQSSALERQLEAARLEGKIEEAEYWGSRAAGYILFTPSERIAELKVAAPRAEQQQKQDKESQKQ